MIAVDPSPDVLAELRAGCSDPRIWFQLGEPALLPFPDGFADAVALDAPGSGPVADELRRVLRRGGRVLPAGSAP